MKEQFYPRWLKREIELKQRKQSNNLVVLFAIFLLISSININKGLKDIKTFKENKSENFVSNHEEEAFIVVGQFNYLYEVLKDNHGLIKGLSILKDTIYLEIYVGNIKEYSTMIKILEEYFEIEEISPLIIDEAESYFKVRMKNYEFI